VDLLDEFEGKKTLVGLEKTVYWALPPHVTWTFILGCCFQVLPLNVGFHKVAFGD
jgi:hypothetical protein